jgi:predicted transcriptional regulator
MAKKLVEIAADIVQAQASVGHMSPTDIEQTLMRTFVTLQRMQTAEEGGLSLEQGKGIEEGLGDEKAQEKMSPQDSIREDKVVCLECGAEMRQLTAKHLSSHELSPREYKKKYGLPLKTPLAAKSLTKARSKAAKKRGLPANLVRYQEERRLRRTDEGDVEPMIVEEVPEVKAPVRRGRKKQQAAEE